MSRAKYWVFTVNNYTDDELNLVEGLVQRGEATYVICGREEGTAGTPHLQGYLELGGRARLSQLKQLGGLARAHLERRRGTQEQAVAYCKKEENYTEFGTPTTTKKGERTDLARAIEAVKDGVSKKELWTDHTEAMVRYSKGILAARPFFKEASRRRTFDLSDYTFHPIDIAEGKSTIVWGESGIGKTTYLRSRFPRFLWVTHMDDLGRLDDEEGIIFDDMSFTHLPRTAQIHITDTDDDRAIHIRYQTARLPAGLTKVFSSNTPEIFDLNDTAIRRRVTIKHVTGPTK